FGWPEHACRGCSLGADQVAHLAHLNARDTTLAYASRAPQKDIERVKARMGWKMPWYTITDSFDIDFGVDEWHGHNAFIRDGDKGCRPYSINTGGDEAVGTTGSSLDITARGRQEIWEDSPEGSPQPPPYKWWNWHDNYDAEASPDLKWVEVSDAGEAAFRKRDPEEKARPRLAGERTANDIVRNELGSPQIVDRSTFEAELDAFRVREKPHKRGGDGLRPPADGFPWSRWAAKKQLSTRGNSE